MSKNLICTFSVRGAELRSALVPLSFISRNATLQEERLINFILLKNDLILTATDSYREGQKVIKASSTFQYSFSVNVEKLIPILSEENEYVFDVYESFLLFKKHNCDLEIPIGEVSHKPFSIPQTVEKVQGIELLQTIRAMEKYISVESDDTGVLVINKGNAYVRSRLFYVITDLPLQNFFMLDKGTVRLMSSMFKPSADDEIHLTFSDNDSRLIISMGNTVIKVPKLRSSPVDLTKFNSVSKYQGVVISTEEFKQAVRELNLVTSANELDLVVNKVTNPDLQTVTEMQVKPAISGSRSNFKLAGHLINTKASEFSLVYTTSVTSLESILSGIKTQYIVVSNESPTLLLLIANLGNGTFLRYYISVM